MAKKTAPKAKKSAKPAPKAKAKPAKSLTKKAAPLKASVKSVKADAKTDKKTDKKTAALKVSPKAVKVAPQKDVKPLAAKAAKGAPMSKAGAALKVDPKVDPKAKKAVALTKPPKKTAAEAAAERRRYIDENSCRETGCDGLQTTSGYCRLHYIKNWKKIKRKELILKEKKLNQYIEELVAKYPDKYIEAIRGDLADEKAFAKVIYDLELDEGIDDIPSDDESDESVIESVKRDFDDTDTDF